MTKYEHGRAAEYKSKRRLEAQGYRVTRAAGSHGMWDLVGYHPERGWIVVQVKTGAPCTAAELKAMRAETVPLGTRKFLHHWTDTGLEMTELGTDLLPGMCFAGVPAAHTASHVRHIRTHA